MGPLCCGLCVAPYNSDHVTSAATLDSMLNDLIPVSTLDTANLYPVETNRDTMQWSNKAGRTELQMPHSDMCTHPETLLHTYLFITNLILLSHTFLSEPEIWLFITILVMMRCCLAWIHIPSWRCKKVISPLGDDVYLISNLRQSSVPHIVSQSTQVDFFKR